MQVQFLRQGICLYNRVNCAVMADTSKLNPDWNAGEEKHNYAGVGSTGYKLMKMGTSALPFQIFLSIVKPKIINNFVCLPDLSRRSSCLFLPFRFDEFGVLVLVNKIADQLKRFDPRSVFSFLNHALIRPSK